MPDPNTNDLAPLTLVPRHVAIIMDGNGRWARARGLPREEGHRKGVDNVKRIVETAKELDIRYLTLYAFSVENWKRPPTEVNALMGLLDSFLSSQSKSLIEKEICFRVVGRLHDMPAAIAKKLEKTMEATRAFKNWNLTLALNYGSRTEIIDAVRGYAEKVLQGSEKLEALNWERFRPYLYTEYLPDPDLVIRTSGEHRLSNFLLLQSAYAEYYFANEFWPDFGPASFKQAIETYQRRERRFGLTGDQIQNTAI
jgi:undecaprenyl diphosphate synthase